MCGVGILHRCSDPLGIGRASGRAQSGPVHQRLSSLAQLCARWRRTDGTAALPGAVPIREKRLVPLLPQYPLPEWSINLIYPPHRHPSNIVRTYLDFCQSYLPKIAQVCEIGVVRSGPNPATVGFRDRVRPSEFPPWGRASPFQGKDRKVRFPRVLPIPVGAGEGRLTEGAPAVRPWWLRLIFLPLSG